MSAPASAPDHSNSSLFRRFFDVVLGRNPLSWSAAQSKMSPTMGPEIASTPSMGFERAAPSLRSSSTSSLHSEDDNVTIGSSQAYSSSSVSIPFDEGDVDVVRVEGLRHSDVRLEARRYKTASFRAQLLDVVHALRILSWTDPTIVPDMIEIQKISGSMTNAVFFVSCPSLRSTRMLLLRIYGPSSGAFISRPRELQILHVLSSQYRIGPRVYGTFENGRIEEHFDATTLTAAEMRDEQISSWIGARMAELHDVDIKAVEPSWGDDSDWDIAAIRNVHSWLSLARDVLALPGAPENVRTTLDLDRFEGEWGTYVRWLQDKEDHEGKSRRVFAHNDTQYGNLLRFKTVKEGMPEHRQIIVVDFEYASPNPEAFDIANHFHEWTANYHCSTPHILNPSLYPSPSQRRNFYRSYLKHVASGPSGTFPIAPSDDKDSDMDGLERQVLAWSPASHAGWALWGVVQAREIVEGSDGEPEFDYLGYAQCRMEGFRRELAVLGLN